MKLHMMRMIERSAAGTLAALLVASSGGSRAQAAPPDPTATNPASETISIVLVHGAFADGSSWSKVVPILEARRFNVIAIQNPLSSLADDVAATKRGIDAVAGPVVLVGHSWGGTVITQAGSHEKVKALVYVAAYAPNEGQSSVDTTKGYPTPPGHSEFRPYGDGYIAMTAVGVAQHFVPDATPAERTLAFVTQGPVQGRAFEESVSVAAWKTKPSFYIVATNDHMIDPGQERAMAKQINATTTELSTSHVPMLSNPEAVADVITAAAHKVSSTK